MMAFFRCSYLVFRQSFFDLFRWKRNWFFLGLAGLFIFLVSFVFWRAGDRGNQNDLYGGLFLGMWMQLLVPITAIYFSASTLRSEISDRSIVFLLSAPVPRSSIWIGKYLAAVLASEAVVMCSFTLATLGALKVPVDATYGNELATSTITGVAFVLALGPIAYAAVGTVFGVRFKWAILWGVAYFIVWESFAGSTPAKSGLRSLTVIDSLRILLYHHTPAADDLHDSLMMWTGAGKRIEMRTAAEALSLLAKFTGISLLIAVWLGWKRDFESSAKD